MAATDTFQFAASSADAKPGKGAGESVVDPSLYKELEKKKNWRRQLSNFAESPFKWKGLTWKTVEHAFQAAKFEQISPETFRSFAMESGSALSKDTGAAAQSNRKIIKLNKAQVTEWDAKKAGIMKALWRAKFTQHPPSKEILLLTGNAKLQHRAPRKEIEHWTDLEALREELRGGEPAADDEDTPEENNDNSEGSDGSEGSPEENDYEAEAMRALQEVEEEEKAAAAARAAPERSDVAVPAGELPMPPSLALPLAAEPVATGKKKANTTLTTVPPATLATGPQALSPRPPADVEPAVPQEKKSTLRFCPTCGGYLFLNSQPNVLQRLCRKCGYKEEDATGGLVMEMRVQERSSEAYKILLNEYTRQDPTLAHIRGPIKCPSAACETNTSSKERDVIPIRWDEKQLKYLYICNVCGFQWRSRD